jgi:bacterioferritin-associated ferredoxin
VIACSCEAVRAQTVRHAIAAGARTVAEIGERCGAGVNCGGCHPLLEELLAEAAVTAVAVGGRTAHHAA